MTFSKSNTKITLRGQAFTFLLCMGTKTFVHIQTEIPNFDFNLNEKISF